MQIAFCQKPHAPFLSRLGRLELVAAFIVRLALRRLLAFTLGALLGLFDVRQQFVVTDWQHTVDHLISVKCAKHQNVVT